MKDYIPPKFGLDAFHCPHCGVYAHQKWFDSISLSKFIGYRTPDSKQLHEGSYKHYSGHIENISFSICSKCEADSKDEKYAIWINKKMVYPTSSNAPLPVEDIPEDVKKDYLEAREIVNQSPRGAAALLRLALQKLMLHLDEEGKNLNKDIGNLVQKGLSPKIQKALDSVRVIGNEAVHPGQMDLKDNNETAIKLFKLMNIIIDEMITKPKEIDQIFGEIPEDKKEGIINRDKAK